jgi:HSP20 family molecular chaperone IbpA
MERAERLRRQFFHHATPYWEAPVDVFESEDALIILIALPGVELDAISVTLSAGLLTVKGERPLPRELENAHIVRMEIPHGRFERRIELPPVPFELSARHLANGCLMLRLRKGVAG